MIKHITYKDKKYPVRISYRALNGFKKDTGMNFEDMADGKMKDFSYLEPLLFHSLVSGCKGEEIEMPFTKKDMPDLLDDIMPDFLNLIPEFFPDTGKEIPQKSRGQKRQEERDKKKKLKVT